MKPKVLFVCEGNTCRSAMAERLAHHLLSPSAQYRSAGTDVHEHQMHPMAERVLADVYGITANDHVPRQISSRIVEDADVIIALSVDVAAYIREHFSRTPLVWSIADPWNKPETAYRATAKELADGINMLELG
jgi:protein-tyrosine-phosphatase